MVGEASWISREVDEVAKIRHDCRGSAATMHLLEPSAIFPKYIVNQVDTVKTKLVNFCQ